MVLCVECVVAGVDRVITRHIIRLCVLQGLAVLGLVFQLCELSAHLHATPSAVASSEVASFSKVKTPTRICFACSYA